MTFRLSPDTKILSAGQTALPTGDCSQVQYVSADFRKGKTPALWKDFPDDDESGWASLPPEERERLTEQLRNAIVNGAVRALWLSFDPWGEDYFLSAEFENGTAALLYNACGEYAAAPIDPDRPDGGERARVDIGGQTPVPRMCAVEDPEKAARLLIYFLETGKLSPETQWAVAAEGLPWEELE